MNELWTPEAIFYLILLIFLCLFPLFHLILRDKLFPKHKVEFDQFGRERTNVNPNLTYYEYHYFTMNDTTEDLKFFEAPLTAKYDQIRFGNFQGKIFRRMFNRSLFTVFTIKIPPVGNFQFDIDFPTSHPAVARYRKYPKKPKHFVAMLNIQTPETELLETFQSGDFQKYLWHLSQLAPGKVSCHGDEFSIHLIEGLQSPFVLDRFLILSQLIFYAYAKVAHLNIPSWRLPGNNYDWWADETLTANALRLLDGRPVS